MKIKGNSLIDYVDVDVVAVTVEEIESNLNKKN